VIWPESDSLRRDPFHSRNHRAIPKRNNSARFSVWHLDMTRKLVIGITGVALLVTLFFRLRSHPGPEHQVPGKFPEQLVYVRSTDDLGTWLGSYVGIGR
jgi:hypothetical protein